MRRQLRDGEALMAAAVLGQGATGDASVAAAVAVASNGSHGTPLTSSSSGATAGAGADALALAQAASLGEDAASMYRGVRLQAAASALQLRQEARRASERAEAAEAEVRRLLEEATTEREVRWRAVDSATPA